MAAQVCLGDKRQAPKRRTTHAFDSVLIALDGRTNACLAWPCSGPYASSRKRRSSLRVRVSEHDQRQAEAQEPGQLASSSGRLDVGPVAHIYLKISSSIQYFIEKDIVEQVTESLQAGNRKNA